MDGRPQIIQMFDDMLTWTAMQKENEPKKREKIDQNFCEVEGFFFLANLEG